MVKIGALQPTSMIDYPGKVSCVVFLSGCNLRCPYCHNPELARGICPQPVSLSWLLEWLRHRRGLLDGVVLSGGEPTLHKGLAILCRQVKNLGFAVKLDTNGSRPGVISRLLDASLIDYLAMDIKTFPGNYRPHFSTHSIDKALCRSIEIIISRAPDYEFRTTCVAPFICSGTMQQIGPLVRGARRYFLQLARTGNCLDRDFFEPCGPGRPLDRDQVVGLQTILSGFVQSCQIR